MNPSRKTATNWLSAIGYRLSAIGYRLILGVLVSAAALQVHADSGREQVESLLRQYHEQSELKWSSNDPRNYIAAWPQISTKLLLAKGFDPTKVHLNDFYVGKWAVLSSTPSVTKVVFFSNKYFDSPPENPQEIVAKTFDFVTRLEPGTGYKIVVDSNDGEYARWKTEMITWRRYVSLGYKNVIDSVYSGEVSERNRQVTTRQQNSQQAGTRQMCEAQKQSCLATCGNPTYWNGRSYVDNQSWSMCYTRCNQISCN